NGSDPYTAWRNANFTAAELNDPAISGDQADPDHDSFTNRQEYIAGTKPKDSSSYLHIVEAARVGNDFVIRFEAVGDKSYTIEGRDRFGEGGWERVLDLSPQGVTKIMDILDPMSGNPSRQFYRIITPQQAPR